MSYSHEGPQPVSHAKLYLKTEKFPCYSWEKVVLCSAATPPELPAFKCAPNWYLLWCSFCSLFLLNAALLLALVMSLLQQINSCHPCKQDTRGPQLLGTGSPPLGYVSAAPFCSHRVGTSCTFRVSWEVSVGEGLHLQPGFSFWASQGSPAGREGRNWFQD